MVIDMARVSPVPPLAQSLYYLQRKNPKTVALKSYFSLFHFNEAYPDVQAEELYLNGKYIERYDINGGDVALYSYHNYYIEVTYSRITNDIEGYIAISVDTAVEKYVDDSMLLKAI